MMNIYVLYTSDVSSQKVDGATRRVLSLVSWLGKKIEEVHLVVPRPRDGAEFELDGVNMVWLDNYLGAGNFKKLLILRKTVKEIQKNKDSIVQVEVSTMGGYLALTGLCGFVLDVHGLSFDEARFKKFSVPFSLKLYQGYKYFLERLGVKRAKRVIVVSESMKEFLTESWHVPEQKVETIPNGYIAEKALGLEGIEEVDGMVSFIGVLEKWARVDRIIHAARALKNERASFHIVGDGPDRNRLERLVREYKLDNVTFTGFVPVNRAYEIIAQSEIVLAPFPGTLALEVACPIKLLEYMALGKAIVADDVGDIPSLLKAHEAALVSNHEDPEEFASNIRAVLNDAKLKKKISKNARSLAENFTWERQAERLAEMYRNIETPIPG
ncbi:glycosyltransferase family 4 protein [Chloroflexota bacterium]